MTGKITMLSYLVAGLLVILFMILGLHTTAMFIFGAIIGSFLIKLLYNAITYIHNLWRKL